MRSIFFLLICVFVKSLFSEFFTPLQMALHDEYMPLTHIDPSIFPGPLDKSDFSIPHSVALPNVFSGCGDTQRHVDGIQLHIIGWRRAKPLKRLLSHLRDADYFDWRQNIPLYLHIDGEHSSEVASIANSFDWPHGSKIVDKKESRLGLREMWLDSLGRASRAAGNNTLLVALEDDVIVSPSYFQWLLTVIDHYSRNPLCRDSRLVGFSLSPVVFQEMFYPYQSWNVQDAMGDLEHGAYLSAVPSSWGAAYWSDQWQEFDKFVRIRMRPPFYNLSLEVSPANLNIPDGASSNSWPKSWKRFMVDFMYGRGLVMLYPNLRNQKGLATALQQDGEHAATGFFGFLGSVNPVVSELVEHYSISIERELPRYGHLIVIGLDHKKTSKERLAALGTKFLSSIASGCYNCESLLSVWGQNNWWRITGKIKQPFICVADIYTSTYAMAIKKEKGNRPNEKFFLYEPYTSVANQLQSVVKAISWARVLRRKLVVPPILVTRMGQVVSVPNTSQLVEFNDFFTISGNHLSNWTDQGYPNTVFARDSISFAEFRTKNLTSGRIISTAEQPAVESSFESIGFHLGGKEHMNLRHIFDQLVSPKRVQHLFGACDDEVLSFSGMLSFAEVAGPWDMVPLPGILKFRSELENVISKVKAHFQLKVGSNGYTCCHKREKDFLVTCNSNHPAGADWKFVNIPHGKPRQIKTLCPVPLESVSSTLQHAGTLVFLSGGSPFSQNRSKLDLSIKSIKSTWVSGLLRKMTAFGGSNFELLSLLIQQQLCTEARKAVL